MLTIRLCQVCVWASYFEVCCLSCACQLTVLELACNHILIIRLPQAAFEVVQHSCTIVLLQIAQLVPLKLMVGMMMVVVCF